MPSNITADMLAKAVKSKRSERGMTQIELARKSGVSLRLISDIESGRADNIGVSRLISVLDLLGISLRLIFDPVPLVEGRSPHYEAKLAYERIAKMVEKRDNALRLAGRHI